MVCCGVQAYVRDAVSPKEYEEACQSLISKFKTLRTALRDNGVVPSVEAFMVRLDDYQSGVRNSSQARAS